MIRYVLLTIGLTGASVLPVTAENQTIVPPGDLSLGLYFPGGDVDSGVIVAFRGWAGRLGIRVGAGGSMDTSPGVDTIPGAYVPWSYTVTADASFRLVTGQVGRFRWLHDDVYLALGVTHTGSVDGAESFTAQVAVGAGVGNEAVLFSRLAFAVELAYVLTVEPTAAAGTGISLGLAPSLAISHRF